MAKRGRPRKNPLPEAQDVPKRGRPRKALAETPEAPVKRGRGRPKKGIDYAPPLSKGDEPAFSFDTKAVLAIASVWYEIDQTIRQRAIKKAVCKKCIPESIVLEVVREMGLDEYIVDTD